MANGTFTAGKLRLISAAFSGIDIRCMAIDNANPYAFDIDDAVVDDVLAGAVAELSTTNYARVSVTAEAATPDNTDNEVVITWSNVAWTALGPASAGPSIDGFLFYIHITNDTDSIPLLWIDTIGTDLPFQVNGGDLTLNAPAEGWLNVA
jgi:hypothetical protein